MATGYDPLTPKQQESEESDGEEDVNKLLHERDKVGEQLVEMQRKMKGLQWDNQARGYHATIEKCVTHFRSALINDYGKQEEGEELQEAQADMVQTTLMLQENGFTLRVCDEFVNHVERTVWVGEIPEQKMTMTEIDNSGNDPVQGYVRDVTYTLDIPVIVKWEKEEEDDNLEIVGVMPATKNELNIQQVKTEKTTPPTSPKKDASEDTGAQKNVSPQESP